MLHLLEGYIVIASCVIYPRSVGAPMKPCSVNFCKLSCVFLLTMSKNGTTIKRGRPVSKRGPAQRSRCQFFIGAGAQQVETLANRGLYAFGIQPLTGQLLAVAGVFDKVIGQAQMQQRHYYTLSGQIFADG